MEETIPEIQKEIEQSYAITNSVARPFKADHIDKVTPDKKKTVKGADGTEKERQLTSAEYREELVQNMVHDAFTVEKKMFKTFDEWCRSGRLKSALPYHKEKRAEVIDMYMEASKSLYDRSLKEEKTAYINSLKSIILQGASFRFLQGVYKQYKKEKHTSTFPNGDKGQKQYDFKSYIIANEDYDINYAMQSRYMKVADYSAELVKIYSKAYEMMKGKNQSAEPITTFEIIRQREGNDGEVFRYEDPIDMDDIDNAIVDALNRESMKVTICTDEHYTQMSANLKPPLAIMPRPDATTNVDLFYKLSELSPTITSLFKVASQLHKHFNPKDTFEEDLLEDMFADRDSIQLGDNTYTRDRIQACLDDMRTVVTSKKERATELFNQYKDFKSLLEKSVSTENNFLRTLKKANKDLAKGKMIKHETATALDTLLKGE